MILEIPGQVFEKYSNIKFRENPSSGSRVVPCGKKDRRTNMTKLIVAFRNFANAPQTVHSLCVQTAGNMLLVHDISPEFLVMNVTRLIKFELLQ